MDVEDVWMWRMYGCGGCLDVEDVWMWRMYGCGHMEEVCIARYLIPVYQDTSLPDFIHHFPPFFWSTQYSFMIFSYCRSFQGTFASSAAF